jgi:lipopolysaccharide transport system permease protein
MTIVNGQQAGKPRETVIEPSFKSVGGYIRALIKDRHLFRYFARNAVLDLYQGTILGWPWLFIRPLLPAVVAAVVLSNVRGLNESGMPYVLFILSGMILVQPINQGLRYLSRSVTGEAKLIKKRYFPRLILPIANAWPAVLQFCAGLVILTVTTAVLAVMGQDVRVNMSPEILLALVAVLIVFTFMVSIGTLLAVFSAAARDVKMLVPMLSASLLFISPVFYSITIIEEPLRTLILILNPLAVAASLFRLAIFDVPLGFEPWLIWCALATTVALCLVSFTIFVRAEPVIADIV